MLFSPKKLGNIDVKNRFIVAPMTRVSANPEGTPNNEMQNYYVDYALGGFGLIITEGTYFDELHSQGYENQPGIANQSHVEGWRKIVDAVHKQNVPILQQLLHAGALIQKNRYVSHAISPSPIQPVGEMAPRYIGSGRFPIPREIEKDEIKQVIGSYGDAAARSMEAGFDGIEIHGANGYLPDQFLTTYTNKREDEFGGTLENRLRFHCEVVKEVRKSIGTNATLGIRISQTKINDFEHEWPGQVNDAKIIFSRIAEAGPDYIHISTHKGLVDVFNSKRNLASLAKEYSGITVIGCGGLHDHIKAQGVLEDGDADFIAISKGALADSALPNKISAGTRPSEFNPEMISPVATISNTRNWKSKNL